jgi:glycine/D-amino acid oxidase-like deaminating enzyme
VNRAAAIADASPVSFWLDSPLAPSARPSLVGRRTADLAVVGGGYTGLWTALLAKTARPEWEVVLLEADRCGWAASGRNGGFCAASLTHGLTNGIERFPAEIATLEQLGRENLAGIETTIDTWGIDCGFERTGELSVATEPHQVDELREAQRQADALGVRLDYLDAAEMQADIHSPTFLAGLWDRDGCALVDPARLAWGLRRACEAVGVEIFEHSPVDAMSAARTPTDGITLRMPHGQLAANRVALGTNASPSLERRLRRYVVPVYDYVLMTEPLNDRQMASIGWERRQGLGGSGNQFLYFRLTDDNRILFGGYDAVYYFNNGLGPSFEQRTETFLTLSRLFAETFPQLEDVRFTHSWAGAIDTCSRFCAFFDRSPDGRVASAAGYTGLGVGASRFAARVILDLLSGQETELTALEFVQHKPVPFPPEPIRYAGIQLTRWSMAKADRHGGRRNLWLRTLDRLGMGFDS